MYSGSLAGEGYLSLPESSRTPEQPLMDFRLPWSLSPHLHLLRFSNPHPSTGKSSSIKRVTRSNRLFTPSGGLVAESMHRSFSMGARLHVASGAAVHLSRPAL